MEYFKADNIHKHFDGVRALDGADFYIKQRAINALIGPNGAGKTTFFNLITGFIKPDDGEIFYKERPIAYLRPHNVARLGIGRTFQNIRLCPQLSVLDNVMLALKYQKGDRLWSAILKTKAMRREDEFLKEKALEFLDLVNMRHKESALGEDLSHGQRRLVEIARALALEPDLLLFDEPMSGLFPEMITQVKTLMRNLVNGGKTILFIEHNMRVVMDVADWIVVLNEGKALAEGTPIEIQNNEAVITAYLGKRKSA